MLFAKGDIIYNMPIRFWEEKTPIKCIVSADKTTECADVMLGTKDSVLVYSEKYGHEVYINRMSLFISEEACKEAIDLYTRLHELYSKDEADKIFKRIFD